MLVLWLGLIRCYGQIRVRVILGLYSGFGVRLVLWMRM